MNYKYERLIDDIDKNGKGSVKLFGNSMMPIINSGSIITFIKCDNYEVGDIVFCKVKSNFYAHKIIAKDTNKGYLIANNRGYENGWTHKIFGKAIQIEFEKQIKII